MNRGLESGLGKGILSGISNAGLHSGLFSGNVMTNKLNMLNPSSIRDPKRTPVFYINADTVALTSGNVSLCYNLIDVIPNQILLQNENIFNQAAGSTYRPPLVRGELGGKNYMDFGDTPNRYLASNVAAQLFCAINSPTGKYSTGTGMTYMFVIRRSNTTGGTVSILDTRDATSLPTTNDLLIELDNSNSITFDYRGGISGTVTSIVGTAGEGVLTDWSILTIKCQLRIDGGAIPLDNQFDTYKRYDMPRDNRIGLTSAIDIFVNGVEQDKKITSNNFTNADHFNDGSYRMFERPIYIGNKGIVYGTGGTHIAAALMIPAYVDKSFQQKLENYFRFYYNKPF